MATSTVVSLRRFAFPVPQALGRLLQQQRRTLPRQEPVDAVEDLCEQEPVRRRLRHRFHGAAPLEARVPLGEHPRKVLVGPRPRRHRARTAKRLAHVEADLIGPLGSSGPQQRRRDQPVAVEPHPSAPAPRPRHEPHEQL